MFLKRCFMALIPIEKAAQQTDIPLETLETLARQGLLNTHEQGLQRCVDDEQLRQVMESLGWLQLSSDNWDDVEV